MAGGGGVSKPFLEKGQMVNSLAPWPGHLVANIQLCCCHTKAAVDSMSASVTTLQEDLIETGGGPDWTSGGQFANPSTTVQEKRDSAEREEGQVDTI